MTGTRGPRPSGSGAWLARFDPGDFARLNHDWAPSGVDRGEALRLFLHEGLERLAPIARGMNFDPEYYREVHPEYADWTDEEAYRQWLFVDLERDWPGSAREHLRRFDLPLHSYPASFDWRAYADAAGIGGNRWFALEHLLGSGLPETGPPLLVDDPGFAAALGLAYRGRDDQSAIAAFGLARRLGDQSYVTAHELADAHYRRGDWSTALTLFTEAAAHADADVIWTYVNGARAGVRIGAYRRAAALLRAGAARSRTLAEWRGAVHELVEARFAARTRRARKLYRDPHRRSRADQLIEDAAESAAGLWDELDATGGALPGPGSGKVLIFANYDIPACVHYRVEQKVEQLRLLGFPAEIFRLEQWRDLMSALPGAAALIVFRLPAWPTVTRVMRTARRMGMPVYYDLDDLIFDAAEYPEPIDTYGGLLTEDEYEAILYGTPLFRSALRNADFGIATTTTLAIAMEPLVRSGRVFVVPNGLDSRNAPFSALPSPDHAGDVVRIIYASGTKAHNADWDALAAPAVLTVLDEQPAVELTIIGHLALSGEFDRFGDRVRRIPHTGDMGRFWDLLAEADINLAVLNASRATDAKSEIKWLEAAVLGIPSLVSATATYREVLEDGVDALLADTPEAWVSALRRLCADPGLRRATGRAAKQKALDQYRLQRTAETLGDALAAARRPAPTPRPRVLEITASRQPISASGEATPEMVDSERRLSELPAARVSLRLDPDPAATLEVRVENGPREPMLRLSTPEPDGADQITDDIGLRCRLASLFEVLRPERVILNAPRPYSLTASRLCRALRTPYDIHVSDETWAAKPAVGAAHRGPLDWELSEILNGAASISAPAGLAEELRTAGFEVVETDAAKRPLA